MALTAKQLKFVQVYAGNGAEAARLAGYKGSPDALSRTAHELLKHPKVSQAIRERTIQEATPLIASRQDRQAFWTEVMQDGTEIMLNRLRASELLGKSEADFTDKVEHEHQVTIRVIDPYANGGSGS